MLCIFSDTNLRMFYNSILKKIVSASLLMHVRFVSLFATQ